jgi:hypothetical protein
MDIDEKAGLSRHQPSPVSNNTDKYPYLWDLVRQDMNDREEYGSAKYGMRSQPFNGRDALIDAYQEALDLALYLRQAIFERDDK